MEKAVRAAGYECILLGTAIEGEARDVAAAQARLAGDVKAQGRRAVILSGGGHDGATGAAALISCVLLVEATPGIEPGYTVLQTVA